MDYRPGWGGRQGGPAVLQRPLLRLVVGPLFGRWPLARLAADDASRAPDGGVHFSLGRLRHGP